MPYSRVDRTLTSRNVGERTGRSLEFVQRFSCMYSRRYPRHSLHSPTALCHGCYMCTAGIRQGFQW